MSNLKVPEGVIIPPPDVREVIETTVGYVVRNGPSFADRILQRDPKNAKFIFLNPSDPYNAFYEWRLSELRAGRGNSDSSGPSIANDSATPGPAIPKEQVREFEFSAPLPTISAQDLDVIKLTALYVARNGTQFQASLGHRESRNFQFDFLKPSHSLYPLFQSLVEQYKKTIEMPQWLKQRIDDDLAEKYAVLTRARVRAESQAKKEEQEQKEREEAEQERIAFAQIDWQDFVVVETIEFTEADAKAALPPPVSLAQLQFASLEQKRLGTYRIEEAPPDFEPSKEPQPEPSKSMVGPERPEPQSTQSQSPSPGPGGPTKGPVIKPAGTSRRDKLRQRDQQERMFISPITNQYVPESEYNEHMRINQLDPKWKEIKAVEQARMSGTNLSTAEVEANLKRLASMREGSEDPSSKKTKVDEVQWDGYTASKKQVRQQAKAQVDPKEVEKQKQQERERQNAIGPKRM
uniref:ARAD1C10010p n=1 Tax=Blastobotrys adeninivorans TaxID=409370 RepID=A0A060T0P9_BLAAD